MWLGVLLEMCLKSKWTFPQVADKVILKADTPSFKLIPQNICPPWSAAKSKFKPLLNFHINIRTNSKRAFTPPRSLCYRPCYCGCPSVILILCGYEVFTTGRFMFSLASLFALVFFHSCYHLTWGRESWSMCFSCICFFILHALIAVLFLFLVVSGIGCGNCSCDCGPPWTFILTFLHQPWLLTNRLTQTASPI